MRSNRGLLLLLFLLLRVMTPVSTYLPFSQELVNWAPVKIIYATLMIS